MTTNLFGDTDFVTKDLYNKIISPTVLFPQVVILNNKN